MKMKIAWLSVSPYAKTGYGRMTREIVSRLLEKYEVMCIGHESDVMVWGARKELLLPNGKSIKTLVMSNPLINPENTSAIVKSYVERYNFDVIIAHWDVFALEFLKNINIPSVFYIPIDAELNQKWANYMSHAHRLVLYSLFGYNEAKKFFPTSKLYYIPHGVDTKVFKPLKEDKEKLKAEIDCYPPIPEGSFLFVTTAANIGERKQLPLLLRTFSKLAKEYEDVHIYLHTNPNATYPQGYDLPQLVNILGIKDRVHFPRYNPITEPIEDEDFCKIYNAADCMVSNSQGEGFGLPILEAMSCGLPVIAPDNSSQTELVREQGFIFSCLPEEQFVDYPNYVPTLQYFRVPDQKDLLDKMRDAYEFEEVRLNYGSKARRFALNYDWELIMPRWFRFLEDLEQEISIFKEIKQMLKVTTE
jgi:glycosyltransferase involved in cell wall biosynthesis